VPGHASVVGPAGGTDRDVVFVHVAF
jgi:hypothetical protein